ncbi:MAG: RimK/LysX family protein [Candidatus Saccharimonadales bacterium]
MKSVLILTSVKLVGKKPTYLSEFEFESKLAESLGDSVTVTIAALPELIYQTGSETRIWHPVMDFDVADFDAVIVRKVGQYLELGIAVAHYAHSKNIPFSDTYLLASGNGKLACAFIRALAGLPVPETVYGPVDALVSGGLVSFPVIVKADIGRAGQDNFLVSDEDQYRDIISRYTDQIMVTQAFIPNDGDYRILVMNSKPILVILRQRVGDSHLNNTSQGGNASLVDLSALPERLLRTAVRASRLEKLQVAGVDIVIDSTTNVYKILEVNRAPQIPSGTYTDEKIAAYATFIQEIAQKKDTQRTLATIGRAEKVAFPEIFNHQLNSRIDSGAKTSSIWASARVEDDGRLAVKLLGSGHALFDKTVYHFNEFGETVVASSNGQTENRYKVKMLVVLGGRRIRAWFTLADRSTQVYPVLIGRNVLMNKFIVDVSRGQPDHVAERARRNTLQIKKGR